MAGLLLEVLLDDRDLASPGDTRVRNIMMALDDALAAADLGEVAGAGADAETGIRSLDVELDDDGRVSEAVVLIRRVLRGLGMPATVPIYRCEEVADRQETAATTTPKIDPTWSNSSHYHRDFGRGRAAS